MDETGFLRPPDPTDDTQRLYEEDIADLGYVMNLTRLWAHQPATSDGLFDLMRRSLADHGITPRQRAVLVAACASAFGDSYCSLAYGTRLADAAGEQTAAGVLRGDDDGLTGVERALAGWARKVARDPNHTGERDVQALRDAGFDDTQIFAITVFVALRIAFSTVNDALGVRPDAPLGAKAPPAVLGAVTFGRPVSA
ncbi:carboxymuconolactone decarboxylase family protein [Planotetraspora kaengkrachanensis]|uniref:Peroxidase-related enzyme n=1 Tax=Planotetraspora kaengkrachanensis TaxID=575193 RepID=A0A8J3PWT7_9ACTN|nr:hypothetical protein [Planotetraspora kaengkrachanensis]GIG82591.1 hypothetical protein Pka01_57180 [Planotetraspora kaengkrachanensis]